MIRFDIKHNTCDVYVAGMLVLDQAAFAGVKIPGTVCVGVCASTASGRTNHICVNRLKLRDKVDEDAVLSQREKSQREKSGRKLRKTIDWKFEKGRLVPSDRPECWRSAGDAVCGSGFELTQDIADQEVRCCELSNGGVDPL